MKLRTALAIALTAVTVVVAACGDDDGGGGEDTAALSIVVDEKGIEAPASAEAGLVEMTLRNDGEDAHQAQLIRVEGGHTADEVLELLTGESSRIPDWFVGGGGVGTTKPGQTSTVTQELMPGSYAIVDLSATKPQSTDFEVSGEATDAALPETDATVRASEYTFEASGLEPGKNTFLFENAGQELHHIVASPVKADATPAQIKKYFQTEEESEDPFTEGEAGDLETAVLDSGQSQLADLDLEAGRYAFMCFIPDRAGGPPHAAKGMITVEDIG